MSRIVWRAAWIGIAVWSVFAWIAYNVVDLFGTGASSVGTVPGFPAEPFTFAWIAAKVHSLGLSAVFAGWLVGVAAIFGIASLVRRVFGPAQRPSIPQRKSWGSSIPSGSFDARPPRAGVFGRLFGR